jgi:hypothetical protein
MKALLKKLGISNLIVTILLTGFPTRQLMAEDPIASERTSSEREFEELATREAIRAANNPTQFEGGIRDITDHRSFKAMTLDMAKFYWAVAAVEFTHCLTSNDSTRCTQFMESLKDPIGHIGFALFMKTNHMTVDFVQVMSRNRINPGIASYLGLAAGMMAQSVFQDIYYHRKVQELFRVMKISDPTRRASERKRVLNELWVDFKQNSGKYLFDKIPNVLGLLGSAYVSHKTVEALGHIFTRSSRLVKFVFDPQTARTIIRYGAGLVRQRQMIKAGFRLAWKGGRLVRVHPVVAIGSYMVETIVFLIWAPIIEEAAVKHWDRANALIDMSRGKSALEEAMEAGESQDSVREKAAKVAAAYDRFRQSIMSKAEITKMRHLIAIQEVDKEFQKMLLYYEWLIQGMDRESDLYTLNEMEFHESGLINSINEAADFAEGFFCGQSPNDAVERTVDVNGLPAPFSWSYDYSFDANRTYYENSQANASSWVNTTGIKLKPFKVHHIAGLCTSELNGGSYPDSYSQINCPLRFSEEGGIPRIIWGNHTTYALFCRVYQSQARAHILRSGKLRGNDIRDQLAQSFDEKGALVMRKIWSQRDLMIMRFERAVREELIVGLSGKWAELRDDGTAREYGWVSRTSILTGSQPLGFIPNAEEEMTFWNDLAFDNVPYSGILLTVRDEVKARKEAAEKLLQYTKTSYSQRVRDQEFFREIPRADWEKVVHSLREYIIP